MDSNAMDTSNGEEVVIAEQLPSVVKSHLPPHLQPRVKKPLEANTGVANASTPAIVKRRQMNQWFKSPTDSIFSPCTQKLMKGRQQPHENIQHLDFDDNEGENSDNCLDGQKQMSTTTTGAVE